MPPLRPTWTRCAEGLTRTRHWHQVRHSSLSRRPPPPPPFPVIATCPSPTCPCSATPTGLDIDRTRDLNGSMSPYAQHVLVSTGQSDWTSKIEDERDTAAWGRFTADMKEMLGRGSEFHDPYNNILISTSSFTPWAERHNSPAEQPPAAAGAVDALLFPAFKHIRGLAPSTADPAARRRLAAFARAFLLPRRLHPIYQELPAAEQRAKTRDPSAAQGLEPSVAIRDVAAPTILVCSHGQRDSRCGILGPLLHAEFQAYIDGREEKGPAGRGRRYVARTGAFDSGGENADDGDVPGPGAGTSTPINVGTISHVGGHKWAGNVIVYVPPAATVSSTGAPHPLAGSGVWYGRVEPRHVQGIVEETLLKGTVIRDLFRGGVAADGTVLRL